MAWRKDPIDMEYDDDDMIDRQQPDQPEPPAYPPNLAFSIDQEDLEKASGAGGSIGDIMPFSAMAEVTSVHQTQDGSRIELRMTQFAGEDGKFFDMKVPGHICFCDFELGRLDLDADCDVGDTIHLIGEARLDSSHRHEFGGMSTLQVVKLTYEDESAESRQGA